MVGSSPSHSATVAVSMNFSNRILSRPTWFGIALPLSMIAPRNKPSSRPPYAINCRPTETAPALSPQIVIFVGSPKDPGVSNAYQQNRPSPRGKHTAKSRDILLDPCKCQPLIPQPNIGISTPGNLIALQKAPSRQPVVEANSDHRLLQSLGVVHDERQIISRVAAGALKQPTAVDPCSNWQRTSCICRTYD